MFLPASTTKGIHAVEVIPLGFNSDLIDKERLLSAESARNPFC